MVAAVITKIDIIDLMRANVKDLGSSSWDFVSQSDYKRLIFRRLQKQTTWNFSLIYTGLWNFGVTPLYIYGMTFTGIADCEYTSYADGSIELTKGTDTRTAIEVVGSEVDFGMVMSDFLFFLATQHADEISKQIQGVSQSPGSIRKELLDMAAMWQGARGS